MKNNIPIQPLVSVILPTYNREGTIKRAVNSVLTQTYRNIELIIVDDGSEDGTVDIIKQIRNEKVSVIRQNHKGANAARNLGIKNAKGEFIAFQDSDDEWLPEKLECQIRYMINNHYESCYCPFYLYTGPEYYEVVPMDYIDKVKYEDNILDVLKTHNVIGTPSLIIHRNIVTNVGLFDENIPRLQDYEYVIRIVQKKKIGYINRPLFKAYKTNRSISYNDNYLKEAWNILLKKYGYFFDIGSYIENLLERTVGTLNEIELNQKIKDIDEYLNTNLNNKKINVYQIAMEYLNHKYILSRDSFCREYEMRKNKLRSGEFSIYGAGYIGKKIFHELNAMNLRPQYFLVTEENGIGELYGIPILKLDNLNDKNMEIIVAVSNDLQLELISNLIHYGYTNYFRYPY